MAKLNPHQEVVCREVLQTNELSPKRGPTTPATSKMKLFMTLFKILQSILNNLIVIDYKELHLKYKEVIDLPLPPFLFCFLIVVDTL